MNTFLSPNLEADKGDSALTDSYRIAKATNDMGFATGETFGPLAAFFNSDTELDLAGVLVLQGHRHNSARS